MSAMPTKMYQFKNYNDDALWNFMVLLTNKDYPQIVGTHSSKYNIVNYHAYTVLRSAAIKDSNGKVVERLIQVRNPWSKEKYNGPWSDNSKEWTANYIK